MATELRHKLQNEIQQADGQHNAQQLHEQLHQKHEAAVRAAETAMREQGTAGVKAAQQLRQTFENQIDSMVEEYHR